MRISICIFFLFSQGLFFGCSQKSGIHEVVTFNEQIEASDDVYISFLTNQIDKYPEEGDNYIKLATIYKGQKNKSKAIELLQKAVKENPENVDILISLCQFYLEGEDIEKLSSTLKVIQKNDPDNMEFLKLSSGYSLLLNDYTNAIFFANRAILVNPYDDENLYLRGGAQLLIKDSLSALISFEEAYKKDNSYKNFSKVFDVSLALGDHNKAGTYLSEFSSGAVSDELCYEWGAFYRETGRKDTAKMILLKCEVENPEEPRVKLELAKIYLSANNIDSSQYYVNQYLTLKPKDIAAYVLKAKTLERISYYSEAKKLYNLALEIDSTSTLASNGLENLERRAAYLRLVKRKESVQRQVETLKPLNSKKIN